MGNRFLFLQSDTVAQGNQTKCKQFLDEAEKHAGPLSFSPQMYNKSPPSQRGRKKKIGRKRERERERAVSYTHLTLPTSDGV